MGESNVVKEHTFINNHSNTVDGVVASQPFVRSNCASRVINEVMHPSNAKYDRIRTTCNIES